MPETDAEVEMSPGLLCSGQYISYQRQSHPSDAMYEKSIELSIKDEKSEEQGRSGRLIRTSPANEVIIEESKGDQNYDTIRESQIIR